MLTELADTSTTSSGAPSIKSSELIFACPPASAAMSNAASGCGSLSASSRTLPLSPTRTPGVDA